MANEYQRSLWGDQREYLQQALIAAFDEAELKRLCIIELDEDFGIIVETGPTPTASSAVRR